MSTEHKLTNEYCAGLFDGEGNVEITNKYALRCRVSNTYEPIIRLLHQQFGGSTSIICPSKDAEMHHKIGYFWTASGWTARAFLGAIFPYLVIKYYQVCIGMEIIPHVRGVKITEPERAHRQMLREQIQRLNKRGNPLSSRIPPK